MKILHITPAYLPAYRYGGPIKSVHAMNASLVNAGVDVTVYTTNINGSEDLDVATGTPIDIDGVRVFYFRHSFPRAWFYSRDMRHALNEHIKEFDVVHVTSVFLSISFLGRYYAQKFKKPYIISPRGNLMVEPMGNKSLKKNVYMALVEKSNLWGASAIHFTTTLEYEEYKKLGFPMRDGVIIPNCLNIEEFNTPVSYGAFRNKIGISKDSKVLLFFGRLSWKKGFDTLIPAFASLVKEIPRAVLAIVGGDDEGYKKTIMQLIERYKLERNVVFSDMLLDEDRVTAFHDSDIFVLPSYSENFGMSVLEALYCGVPTLVTDGVGIAPDIKDAGAGVVVSKEVSSLYQALLKLFQNPVECRRMSERGRALVLKKFTKEKVADQFLDAYKKIIK